MFIGSVISGKVKDHYSSGDPVVTNWTNVWLVPAGIAVVVLLLFVLLFKDESHPKPVSEKPK
jgi:hypothetical protein